MSALVEIFQMVVETQGIPPLPSGLPGGLAGIGGGTYNCSANCDYFGLQPGCPGSSFTAMGAAFATQGYFAQADLLWQLTNTNMGLWAPLLYIFAAIGGMTSLAMGMPPKMYMWFFMGPAIYHFLLGTTLPAQGTSWCVANVGQDQTEVWKLAEVGLTNSNIVALSKTGKLGTPPIEISQWAPPSEPVYVSYLFLWFDGLVSSTVQWMTVWTGIYQQRGGTGDDSGIIERPNGTDYGTTDQFYLMSNLKWSILDRMTSARLHNGDVRDAFVTFMSSECGDALSQAIDPGLLIAASNSRTGELPNSLFRGVVPTDGSGGSAGGGAVGGTCQARNVTRDYKPVTKKLANQMMPLPRSIRRSWWNPDRQAAGGPIGGQAESLRGSLPGFYAGQTYTYPAAGPSLPGWGGFFGGLFGGGLPGAIGSFFPPTSEKAAEAIDSYLEVEDNITCADSLFYIINAFRWEAGNIYYQLASTAPKNMKDDDVVYNLFYGWDLRDECGAKLSGDKLNNFMIDLTLLHLIRNEMALAPKVADSRFMQQGSAAGNASNRYIAETGAKSKFGEVYTWALMMPYVQGVLLYLLAMAYPFVCILIVVPGMHKTLFTWMAFWTWVKLWDLGFAVVLVLERSIWAAMGNSSVAANLSSKVAEMQRWGVVNVSECSRVGNAQCPPVPDVTDGIAGLGAVGQDVWNNLLAILDRAMLVGSAIDLDVQNGYYIYIMAALYFAVPAVTGQLVLGAKAGAAGMVSNLTQGAQSDGGRAASQAFTGALRNTAAASSAAVNQEKYAKAMRQEGLAAQAIEAGNAGLSAGLASSAASQAAQGFGNIQGMQKLVEGLRGNNLQTGGSLMKGMTTASGILGAGGTGLLSEIFGLSAEDINKQLERNGGTPGGASPQGDSAAPGGPAGMSAGGGRGTGVSGSGATGLNWGNVIAGGKFIGGAWQMGQAVKNSAIDMATAAQGNAIHRGFAGTYAGLQAQQANAGLSGFFAGAQGQGYQLQTGRMSQAAGFSAEQSAFEGRRDFANQTSGYLSALGVDSSVVSPGNKPTDMMGMAMAGMLGSGVKSSANYANPNGGAYFGQAQSAYGGLSGQFGGAALGSIYGAYGGDAVSEMNGAWGQYKGMPGAGGFDSLDDWKIKPVDPSQPVSGDGSFIGGNR